MFCFQWKKPKFSFRHNLIFCARKFADPIRFASWISIFLFRFVFDVMRHLFSSFFLSFFLISWCNNSPDLFVILTTARKVWARTKDANDHRHFITNLWPNFSSFLILLHQLGSFFNDPISHGDHFLNVFIGLTFKNSTKVAFLGAAMCNFLASNDEAIFCCRTCQFHLTQDAHVVVQ